jgi:hypothetical protein
MPKADHRDRISGQLRRAAFHEAGHASMALILGDRLHMVTVRERMVKMRRMGAPNRSRKLHVAVEAGRAEITSRSPSGHLLTSIAGAAAECIQFRKGARPQDADLAEVGRMLTTDGQRVFLRIANALLRAHWPGVMAVAHALEARGRLSGAEAKRVFLDGLLPPASRKRTRSTK